MVKINSKHAFWQAFVFTVVIFLLGMLLGVFLESFRADSVQVSVLNSEVSLLDQQLRTVVSEGFSVGCDLAVNNTFDFADRVYVEALILEDYESSAKFTNVLIPLHKRYDLLRTMLWTESVKLRDRCSRSFHTVVYLYDFGTDDIELKSKQLFFSRLLEDLKNNHPDEMLLIPIAANLDLDSVNLIKSEYGVEELPVVIIDEERIVSDIISLRELETIVFTNNN